jgi:hypothetical protein
LTLSEQVDLCNTGVFDSDSLLTNSLRKRLMVTTIKTDRIAMDIANREMKQSGGCFNPSAILLYAAAK